MAEKRGERDKLGLDEEVGLATDQKKKDIERVIGIVTPINFKQCHQSLGLHLPAEKRVILRYIGKKGLFQGFLS